MNTLERGLCPDGLDTEEESGYAHDLSDSAPVSGWSGQDTMHHPRLAKVCDLSDFAPVSGWSGQYTTQLG